MSGLAGVVRFDGRAVSRADLEPMTAATAYRGVDGTSCWSSSPDDGPTVGLAFQLTRSTTRPLTPQPHTEQDGRFAVVLDGRLDNRPRLGERLEVEPAELARRGDAWLVLRAYRRWGAAVVEHLLGDFALALWDARERRLFCARDPMGIRQLVYRHEPGCRFLFATEVRQLLAVPGVPRDPNPGMVAEFLARAVTHCGETIYEGIQRLPHGSWLTVDAGGLTERGYWRAEPPAPLRYRRDEEYAEHFFELFAKAVGCRLDVPGAMAVSCGGGIDSSSIVGMTQALAARGQAPPVELFCLDCSDPPEADERRYAHDVATFHGLPLHLVALTPPEADDLERRRSARSGLLELPGDQMSYGLMAAVRDRGIRAGLNGAGGDQGFFGTLHHYADLLRELRLLALWRQVRADRETDIDWRPSSLVVEGLWPITPAWLRRAISPWARRWRGDRGYPAWIRPALAEAVGLEERLRPPHLATTGGPRAVQEIRREYTSGWPHYFLESAETSGAEWRFEERYPLYDRRIIDFALAIPDDQRWRGRLTRYVFRHAMREYLPVSVLERETKADFSHHVVTALRALGGRRRFEELAVAEAGWVDQAEVLRLYDEMEDQLAKGEDDYDIFTLWFVAGVELWLRDLSGPTSGPATGGGWPATHAIVRLGGRHDSG